MYRIRTIVLQIFVFFTFALSQNFLPTLYSQVQENVWLEAKAFELIDVIDIKKKNYSRTTIETKAPYNHINSANDSALDLFLGYVSVTSQDNFNRLYKNGHAPKFPAHYERGHTEGDRFDQKFSVEFSFNDNAYELYQVEEITELNNQKNILRVFLIEIIDSKYYFVKDFPEDLLYLEKLFLEKPIVDIDTFFEIEDSDYQKEVAISPMYFYAYSNTHYRIDDKLDSSHQDYALLRSLQCSDIGFDNTTEYLMDTSLDEFKKSSSPIGLPKSYYDTLKADLTLVPQYKVKYKHKGQELIIVLTHLLYKDTFKKTKTFVLAQDDGVWKSYFISPKIPMAAAIQFINKSFASEVFVTNSDYTLDSIYADQFEARSGGGINVDLL